MRRFLAALLLAAGCSPPQRDSAFDAARDALLGGDLERAEALLAGDPDPSSLHLRARLMMLRHRPDEAIALLGSIPEKERGVAVYHDLSAAYVQADDFAGASSLCGLMGQGLLAKKYDLLSRRVGYLVESRWDMALVNFLSADPVPMVPVRINGTAGIFIVDTGLGEVVLDRSFARRAGVKAVGLLRTDSFRGTFDEAVIDEVKVGSLKVLHVPARLGKTSLVGRVKPDGALGLAFLRHFDFTIDYRRERLVLRPAGREPLEGVPALLAGDRYLLASGKVDGVPRRFFCLSTGMAGVSAAPSAGFLRALRKPVGVFELGALRVERPPSDTKPFPSGLEVSFGVPVVYVLGGDAFRGRVLRFDPKSMRLSLD